MTFSYDSTLPAALDKVRLLIGDTNEDKQKFEDEELEYFLTEAGQSVPGAAARAMYTLARRYSEMVDKTVGDLSISYSQRAASARDLATELEQSAGEDVPAVPRATGLSKAGKEAVYKEPDRVPNTFTTGMQTGPVDYTRNG